MTAVVRLAFGGKFPVLVGDLLVSEPVQPTKPIQLPTFKELPLFPKTAEYHPSGCKQKIAIVDDRLVLGWAGTYANARDAISGLHGVCRSGFDASVHLDGFLDSVDDDGTGFAGFLLERDGRIQQFGYSCYTVETNGLGRIGFLGSGGCDLLEHLSLTEQILPADFSDSDGKPVPFNNKCILATLFLTGFLLQTELANAGTLQQLFGGGYEIAYKAKGNGFRKLDSVTYAFWHVRVESGDVQVSLAPHHVIAYGYTRDILTIRSLSVFGDGSQIRPVHWYDHIMPFYRKVQDAESCKIELPSFNSTWLCHYFYTEGLGAPAIFAVANYRASGRQQQLHFSESAHECGVYVEKEFLEQVRCEIAREAERAANDTSGRDRGRAGRIKGWTREFPREFREHHA